MNPGDILTIQRDGSWSTVKILLVDTWPDGSQAAHCLFYVNRDAKPDLAAAARLGVRVQHAPMDAGSFGEWQYVGNLPLQSGDLRGFETYLKMTDFPRYLEFTQQEAGPIVEAAARHYRRASQLHDEKNLEDAVAEYERAIDRFPLFHEAIDNRGFALMELGRFEAALAAFDESLRLEPNGFLAFARRAECYLRLKEYAVAEAQYSEALERFPEHRETFQKYLELARGLGNGAR